MRLPFDGLAALARKLLRAENIRFGFAQTVVTQVVVNLVYMATGVLTARLLGPEGRGVFAAMTLWPQLLAVLALAGLPFALTYHLRNATEADRGSTLGAVLALGLLSGALCLGLAVPVIFWTMSGSYPPETILFTQLFAVMMLANMLSMLGKQGLSALGRIRTFNLASWAEPTLNLVLLVAVVLATTLTPQLAAACLAAETLMMVAWIAWKLFGICRPRLSWPRELGRQIASYAIRASGINVLATVALYLDRLALMMLFGPYELGLYVVAFNLSRIIFVLRTAIEAVIFPQMAGAGQDAAKALYDRTFRVILVIATAAVVVAIAGSSMVVTILYGDEFTVVAPILSILFVEAAITCLSQSTSQLYMALGFPGFASYAQAAGLVVTGAGLAGLVPALGPVGAAAAVTIGAFVRLTILLAGIPLKLKMSLPRLSPVFRELASFIKLAPS